jgi:hypothetical protein
MSRTTVKTAAMACLGAVACAAAAAAETAMTIEARAFDGRTGGFSGNLLAPGASAPAQPSALTLVRVKVSPDGPIGDTARVRLIASGLSKPGGALRPSLRTGRLLDKAVTLPALGPSEDRYAAFVLPEGPCAPVALTAELQDPPRRTIVANARLQPECPQ